MTVRLCDGRVVHWAYLPCGQFSLQLAHLARGHPRNLTCLVEESTDRPGGDTCPRYRKGSEADATLSLGVALGGAPVGHLSCDRVGGE